MQEIRRDPLHPDRWIIFSTDFRLPAPPLSSELPQANQTCPLCPGHEKLTPAEIQSVRDPKTSPNTPGWTIRVVPNKFPILRIEGVLESQADGLYDKLNGIGANEIVVAGEDHLREMDEMPLEHLEKLFQIIQERVQDLKRDVRLKYVQVYKNKGPLAGATLGHPHFQLIGLPMIPKALGEELQVLAQHRERRGRCLICDLIRQEERFPERIIAENERFIAVCPYASRVPFETWILPKHHAKDFSQQDRGDLALLLRLHKDISRKIKRLLKDPSSHWVLHTAPFERVGEGVDFHWRIEILPQIYRQTGFEWGTEYYINPVAPEEAAEALRNSHN